MRPGYLTISVRWQSIWFTNCEPLLPKANVQDIINDPNFLAYKFNFNTESVEFLPIELDELRKVSFLRRDAFDSSRELISVPLDKLVNLVNLSQQKLTDNPPRFIFHTAYCASTYLSRSLDLKGVNLSLREPQLLLDAANAKRLQWSSKSSNLDYRHLPALALVLLQKHVSEGENWLIKPINSVNNIVSELTQLTAGVRSVLLYSDAKTFVLSTLSKGEEGRQTTRAMFDLLRCDFPHLANLTISDALNMSDLKLILTFWRLQIEQVKAELARFSAQGRMASLLGENVIQQPHAALTQANRFLDLGLSENQISLTVNDASRYFNAKDSEQSFSIEKRDQMYAEVEAFFDEDLKNGFNWLSSNNPNMSLSPILAAGLL